MKKFVSLVSALIVLITSMSVFNCNVFAAEEEISYFSSELISEKKNWEGSDVYYTDENGVDWFYSIKNYRLSETDPNYYYRELTDSEIAIIPNPCVMFSGEIEVPSTLDGKTVIRLDPYFLASEEVTSVILPETIIEIGYRAFSFSTSIRRVVIGKNVKYISDRTLECIQNPFTIYYTGTESDWESITVYHLPEIGDPNNWTKPNKEHEWNLYDGSIEFNADVSEIPDLEEVVEEDKPLTFFEKILLFFRSIAEFFGNLFSGKQI